MGTTVRAWVAGPDAEEALDAAEARVAELEARWSRFRDGSDVSRLNAAGGRAVAVHPETIELVDAACRWWAATEGRFDPTVLAALEAAGYDRDRATGHGPIGTGAPAPGCAEIELDRRAGMVRLPPQVRIDLGGIGKGWTADLLAQQLQHHRGGLVDLGGDLRAWGRPPQGEGWPIAVDDLRDGSQLAVLGLTEGAVATSSTLRRRWSDGARHAHHLIDPRTGQPTSGEVVSVTVVAGRAAPAEVLAKAALVTGSVAEACDVLARHDVDALVVPSAGPPALVGDVAALCWVPPMEVR